MKDVQVILPCLDEGPALRTLLPQLPAGMGVIVVDNGSKDNTSAIARAAGATVIYEPARGYGAAVHAGVLAATAPYLVVMDGDGSIDPTDIVPLLTHVRFGGVDLAVGRRVPVRRGLVPWHARLGNALVLALLRKQLKLDLHDIGPIRAMRRDKLLQLGVNDRGMGYPVELLDKAARAGWVIHEADVAYLPRAAGTRSKVSGSVRGTLRTAHDFWKVLR
ncbi:MAG: glycosyltransferase family 2 protein [Marmoricola sp.]